MNIFITFASVFLDLQNFFLANSNQHGNQHQHENDSHMLPKRTKLVSSCDIIERNYLLICFNQKDSYGDKMNNDRVEVIKLPATASSNGSFNNKPTTGIYLKGA